MLQFIRVISRRDPRTKKAVGKSTGGKETERERESWKRGEHLETDGIERRGGKGKILDEGGKGNRCYETFDLFVNRVPLIRPCKSR